jgi:hypothetical protein
MNCELQFMNCGLQAAGDVRGAANIARFLNFYMRKCAQILTFLSTAGAKFAEESGIMNYEL